MAMAVVINGYILKQINDLVSTTFPLMSHQKLLAYKTHNNLTDEVYGPQYAFPKILVFFTEWQII